MDLRTTYMGLKLKSPIVVSACTLSEEVGNIVQMEDAGAGAVVLFSLFEEQLKKEEEEEDDKHKDDDDIEDKGEFDKIEIEDKDLDGDDKN